jgi:hypothetical protein
MLARQHYTAPHAGGTRNLPTGPKESSDDWDCRHSRRRGARGSHGDAAFPAQSLADTAAKCAFAAKQKEDYELAVATVETTAEDAERLAGKGGAA